MPLEGIFGCFAGVCALLEFNLDINDESRSLNSSLSHQPAQESMRKPRQSEENVMQLKARTKARGKAVNPANFAKPANISLNLRKFRRFRENFADSAKMPNFARPPSFAKHHF